MAQIAGREDGSGKRKMRRRRYRGRRSAGRMGAGRTLFLCLFFLAVSGMAVMLLFGETLGLSADVASGEIGKLYVGNSFPTAEREVPNRGGTVSRKSGDAAEAASLAIAEEPGETQDGGAESSAALFQGMMGSVFPGIGAEKQEGTQVADASGKNKEEAGAEEKAKADAEAAAAAVAAEQAKAEQAKKDAEAAKQQEQPAVVDTQTQLTPQVIIYHTHATESFLPVDDGNFHSVGESGTVREVGNELTAALEAKGIGVIHDKTIHDNPSYNQSYGRSLETVKRLIAQNPTVKIVIDLHRDAAGTGGGAVKTTQIDGQAAAQFSLVVGKGNPNYEKLNAFANQIVSISKQVHPGLVGRVIPKEYKYNQYVSDHHLLMEVGNNLNTIDQVKVTGKEAADIIAKALEQIK